ncbi:MAG: hypothetical protein A3F13_04160 [Gammaproteobacteria bacterium RIFCSPHIGHO2_12_FULL_40_19]|nr:MAG: hypothetical protein A3F13_04160 [Gammaproteobacteria bacterium RIFCSPHIGHO2_12_FULL_40_19]
MNSETEIVTNEIQAIYPANSLQQGFIFHAVSQPHDDAYLVQSLCDYDQAINVEIYRQAWTFAFNTYPTLRLCFNWDENPIQIITKHGHLDFSLHDISKVDDKNEAILKLQQSDRKQLFDLTKPTLLRLHLIKQDNNHYTLLKTEHHSIADAWSAAILLNQVHHFYHQLISGITPTITQDIAYLQSQAFITKHQSDAQNYWRKAIHEMDHANDLNTLFTQYAKPESLNHVKMPCEMNVALDVTHYERLKKLVHDEGLTLHGLVQFAWHKLLHTYTSDAQTIVGTIVSGRTLPITDIEKSVGLYINTLPLMMRWDNALTIKEQLHHLHAAITGLNKYSFVYLSALQRAGNRLFNSLLLFENLSFSPQKPISDDYLVASNRRGIQKLNYPLVLTVHVKNNTLCINFKYDGAYLNEQRAHDLLKQLLIILQQIPCRFHAPHHTLDLLTPEVHQQIIHQWNETTVEYPEDQTLQDMFEMQVLRSPNAVAVVFEEQKLTYVELDAKANQLAHWLHENGLKSGELVALCLDRSIELLIAIHGVLKAGCAYVPIDPEYPLERISYVLKDTESRFLLTQSQHASQLESRIAVPCVCLDERPYQYAMQTPFVIPRISTDLAYVIYTSGTTGNPKGVALSHKSVVNRIHWMQSAYLLDERDVVLQKTPYAFDVSVWELLWAHWTGAKIVMARPDGHKDPQYLQSLILKEKVTVLHFVPSMLSAFTEMLSSFKMRVPNSLRLVFCSGEALLANQVAAFYQLSNDTVTVYNLYGPTEAAIDVTAFTCHRNAETVYIGRPIQNTRIYVLNAHLKPVPVGAVGELYLGGAGLAREYWHQPELTAASFIHNPFAQADDLTRGYIKLYKTGDRVRWRSDGNLEYLGRVDSQVKIRGFRIELSEIEQTMLNYPDVSQAVALVKEHNTSEHNHRFIAAYYVGNVTETILRQYLATHLPDYMIPTSLMALEVFPVTRNGKLDRKVLPLPIFMKETIDEMHEPRNPLEKTLCDIWKKVLTVSHVKITDNFFELGGDSIGSIRLVAKMQDVGFYVSIHDLFKHKTIVQLVEQTNHSVYSDRKIYAPFSLIDAATKNLFLSGNIEDIYPAAYLQMGMLVESLKITAAGTYHDVFSYTIHCAFNETLLLNLFKQLMVKHSLLRTAFVENENYGYLCVQYSDVDITAHYQGIMTENVSAFIRREKNRKFSIDKPGLFSLFVLNPTPDQFVLVFSFHHAITDGWSVASLITELTNAYRNEKLIVTETMPLYQQVIQHERLALLSNTHSKFWREYLADAPSPVSHLIFYPKAISDKNFNNGFVLDDERAAKLLSTAKHLGVSPDNIFLAAILKTLSRFFNNDDVIIGLVMNNRLAETGGDKVFGLHLNTLPLRLRVSNKSTKLTIALSEQRTQLNAFKAYPFGKIRSDILEGNEAYTCAFNYIHFHVIESQVDSHTVSGTEVFEKTTLPFTLHVARHHNRFRITIKAVKEFIDQETLRYLMDYLLHDLNAIVNDIPFSWISPQHAQLFSRWYSSENADTDDEHPFKIYQPRNALEKSLCEIWQSVLNIARIGITDNFFELGGDSIRCIRLVAKMQNSGFYVSVADIFKHKTILQLIENTNHTLSITHAAYVPFSLIDNATRTNIFARNEGNTIEDIYPAGYLQMGMLVESLKTNAEGAYHDVFAYTIRSPFNKIKLLTLFKTLSEKHALLRTAFVAHDEYGYICVQYENIDISSYSSHYGGIIKDKVPAFIQAEKNRSLSIDKPGLFRLFALNPTVEQFVLVFSFHHAITDGWSVASLISEFTNAYVDEEPITMEEMPPYQRVIQQERLALLSSTHETFWRDYLSDAPTPKSNLIFHPNAQIDQEHEIACVLDDVQSTCILSTAKRLGISPDSVFLAAYFKSISRFFNDNDVIIGIVMNNRLEESGGDKVFGLHLNTLPMRLQVGENSLQLTIELSRQRAELEAYKSYPFGKIRTDILQSNDAYTCAFNYIHFHIVDSETTAINTVHVFEKTTIPLTLHVSRQTDCFRMALKSLNAFIDHETADLLLAYIHHDLNAITNTLEFSWLSENHPEFFFRLNTTLVSQANDQSVFEKCQPRNALEKTLCDTWKSVLNVPEIGITDNFFALGGDSIQSIRLVAKMHEIGFYVAVKDIFKHKTILQLIENVTHSVIAHQQPYLPFSLIDDTTQNLFIYDHTSIEDIYPAGFLQMGMLIESLKTDADGAYHDVFAYTLHRPFNEAVLLAIFKQLSIKHPLLRTAFVESPQYGYVCLQYADLDIHSHFGGILSENITTFIQKEKNRPFSIDKPGLFCFFVLNATAHQFTLVFSFHHAIMDGWSIASLISQLMKMYIDEKPIDIETIPLYQRVIQQERFALALNTQETFWRDYLTDAPLPKNNFVFHPKAMADTDLEIRRALSDEKSATILLTAKRFGLSPDMLFLAAYFKTVSRFFNHPDVVLGLVMNNRLEEAGGDKVFGLHLNTLPLRLRVDDNNAPQLVIALSHQRTQLDSYKAYPYGKIRSEIFQGNDIYTCAFNYIHFHVVDAQSDSFDTTHVFEKTTIPLTLHVSRQKNSFHITLKSTNKCIDSETANLLLDYIQHDLNAIMHDLEFTWISEDHPKLFSSPNTPFVSQQKNQPVFEMREPRNAVEKSLCTIWQSVLNISQISITDNFFELGGDSIQSIRLVAKMHEIGFYVSVNDLFKHKTILQLVEHAHQTAAPTLSPYISFSMIDDATRVNILTKNAKNSIDDIYPAGYLQTTMLNASQKTNADGAYHDVFAYTLYRSFNEDLLLDTFKMLTLKNPMLRTAFVDHPEYGYVCVQYTDLDIVSHYGGIIEEVVPEFIHAEKNRLFSIENPGLFSVFVLNPTDDQFVLVFSFHHAITDGWSVASLMSAFAQGYANQEMISNNAIPLYQRVVQQERVALLSNTPVTFWRDYLADAPLPKNSLIAHPNALIHKQLELGCVLDDAKATTVLSTAKRLGISPDTVFLAAYFKTLSALFNQADIVLGLVMNNRLEENGGDKVFGLHLNILPLRMKINLQYTDDNDAFILALAEERLRIAPHKAYPYEKLCHDLNTPAGFYTCAFNYTHFYVNNDGTQEKLIQPIYAFEKMLIPFTLQVSRNENVFRLIIRTSYQFSDKKMGNKLLALIQGEL